MAPSDERLDDPVQTGGRGGNRHGRSADCEVHAIRHDELPGRTQGHAIRTGLGPVRRVLPWPSGILGGLTCSRWPEGTRPRPVALRERAGQVLEQGFQTGIDLIAERVKRCSER